MTTASGGRVDAKVTRRVLDAEAVPMHEPDELSEIGRERGDGTADVERFGQIGDATVVDGMPQPADKSVLSSRGALVVSDLTRAKLVRDARGDGVEDGLRRVAGWGLRYDL
ncbi:hypothetical protein, partial [Microbacterium aurantiacum]|uniref:hypothetical protein n=1 Tax=Microbacterium aurantiacum TaxID=162393 RepID=UPI00342233F2